MALGALPGQERYSRARTAGVAKGFAREQFRRGLGPRSRVVCTETPTEQKPYSGHQMSENAMKNIVIDENLLSDLSRDDRSFRLTKAIEHYREKIPELLGSLQKNLATLPIVDEQLARNCGEVYNAGLDMYHEPFHSPEILSSRDIIKLLCTKILSFTNSYEKAPPKFVERLKQKYPSIKYDEIRNDGLDVIYFFAHEIQNRSTDFTQPKTSDSILTISPAAAYRHFCFVRIDDDAYLEYDTTMYIRGGGGESDIPTIPKAKMLGICFNIKALGDGNYGQQAWQLFWQILKPKDLRCTHLFHGDTDWTLKGLESIYVIAIENEDYDTIRNVQRTFSTSEQFQRVSGSPMFKSGTNLDKDPLMKEGWIDENGHLEGGKGVARRALKSEN